MNSASGLARNIAELERALALERAARAEAEAEVSRLRNLQAVTEVVLSHPDLDDLLDEQLTRIRAALSTDTAAILLLNDDATALVARAAKGLEEEVERGVTVPLGRGFAGRIAAERRPVILDHVDHTTVMNPILYEKGIRSLLGVPLLVNGCVFGVLHVGTLSPRRFTGEDVHLLQLVADRVALAIDHSRLYEAERQARQEAEAAGRAKDEFIAVMSQELLHPLGARRLSVIPRGVRQYWCHIPTGRLWALELVDGDVIRHCGPVSHTDARPELLNYLTYETREVSWLREHRDEFQRL